MYAPTDPHDSPQRDNIQITNILYVRAIVLRPGVLSSRTAESPFVHVVDDQDATRRRRLRESVPEIVCMAEHAAECMWEVEMGYRVMVLALELILRNGNQTR